jgi:hypothetical protein
MKGYDELMARVRQLEELYGTLRAQTDRIQDIAELAARNRAQIQHLKDGKDPEPDAESTMHIILHDITELVFHANPWHVGQGSYRAAEYLAREIYDRWVKTDKK